MPQTPPVLNRALDAIEVAVTCRLCGGTLHYEGEIDGVPGVFERVRLRCDKTKSHAFTLTITLRVGATRPAITSAGGERP